MLQAYGTWNVSTDGDEEGRSIKNLGTYTGFLDDIAFALADRAMYDLKFEPVQAKVLNPIPKRKEVEVCLDVKSGTWHMKPPCRVTYYNNLLKGRPTMVEEGQYYASVKLISTQYSERDIAREKALSKLTDEEKELLNLK